MEETDRTIYRYPVMSGDREWWGWGGEGEDFKIGKEGKVTLQLKLS